MGVLWMLTVSGDSVSVTLELLASMVSAWTPSWRDRWRPDPRTLTPSWPAPRPRPAPRWTWTWCATPTWPRGGTWASASADKIWSGMLRLENVRWDNNAVQASAFKAIISISFFSCSWMLIVPPSPTSLNLPRQSWMLWRERRRRLMVRRLLSKSWRELSLPMKLLPTVFCQRLMPRKLLLRRSRRLSVETLTLSVLRWRYKMIF